MQKNHSLIFASIAFVVNFAAAQAFGASAHRIELTPLGTYASGIFNQGAAEIVAHDPATQRLFVVNAQAATVDVLDISNPAQPEKIRDISLLPFGGVANSVAV